MKKIAWASRVVIVILSIMSCIAAGQTPGSRAVVPSGSGFTAWKLAPHSPGHIIIVIEENHSYNDIIGSPDAPFINELAKQGALFSNSFGVQHPSEPNYLALFSGSTQGVKDDSCGHTFVQPNLGSELIKSGHSFGGYSEDLPAVGSLVCSMKGYGRKHNPWSNFTNVPKSANMPLTQFPTDYRKLPTVSIVIPNMSHDMHDGTVKEADQWLKNHMESYIKWAKQHNSLLILTWDEDDFSKSNHIPTIFAGSMIKAGVDREKINHLNVLRTIEDLYHLGHVGDTGSFSPITGAWNQPKG